MNQRGMLGAMLTVVASMGLVAVADTQQGEKPQPAKGHAITFTCSGLEGALVDPKDKGLMTALRMLDDRILELPRELNQPEMPASILQMALEMLMSPMSFRAGMLSGDEAGQGPPIYAQLSVKAGDAKQAQEWAGRFSGFVAQHAPMAGKPATDMPGMTVMDMDGVPGYFGPAMVGGESTFTLAINKVDSAAIKIGPTDLPENVRPAMTFSFDAQQIQPLIQMLMAQAGPQASMVKQQLSMMGLYGPDALKVTAAMGYGPDRSYGAARFTNYRKTLEKTKMLAAGGVTAGDLRLIPADATFAQVSKFNIGAIGETMRAAAEQASTQAGGEPIDPMAMIEQQTGVNPQRDILDHLGQTMGFYMSESTGGGGLLSMVGFVEVKNAEALNQTITRMSAMVNQLAQQHAKGYVRMASRTVNNQTMTALTFPGLPVPLELSFAVADGWMYVSASPQTLLAAIDHSRKGKGGLADNPRFKEMGGDQAVGAMKVTFIDTPRMLSSGYGLVSLGMAALSNVVRSPVDPSHDAGVIMPSYAELSAGAKSSLSLTRLEGDDLVIHTQGDRSLLVNACGTIGVLGGTTGAIATAALAGGVFLPAVGKARETAIAARSMASLKHISVAAVTYAAEFNDDVPPSLDVLIEHDYIPQDLAESPFGPVGDDEGDYFFNSGAVKKFSQSRYPDQQVLGYDRAMLASKNRTTVLFFDGHVMQMSRSEFERILERPANAGVDFKVP